MSACVDVIIPVYRAEAETRRCLDSVLAHPGPIAHEVIVIDDASGVASLAAYLDHLADAGRITLIRHADNAGFVRTVNEGMALHPQRDVVLLNSDTEVANDWLHRLRRAVYRDADIATATPFSNNATICSYPWEGWTGGVHGTLGLAALDRLIARANAGGQVDIPTAVGFCMYIRRACLDAVGLFDAERFGRGYGEENDFCMRAAGKGWRHILAGDVYVYHAGGASFAGEQGLLQTAAMAALLDHFPDYPQVIQAFLLRDPVAALRQRIDVARCATGPVEAAHVRREAAGRDTRGA
mgnify:CR=1 FL=1